MSNNPKHIPLKTVDFIMKHYKNDMSTKKIALKLGVKETTVRTYANVLRRPNNKSYSSLEKDNENMKKFRKEYDEERCSQCGCWVSLYELINCNNGKICPACDQENMTKIENNPMM